MKIRDSGLPAQQLWEGFFDPPRLLAALGCRPGSGAVLEFGCGYGTFTLAAACMVEGTVHALDIDPEMVATTRARAARAGLANVSVEERDFLETGSGRPPGSIGFAMLFSILHLEQPAALLRETARILRPGGTAGIAHWRADIDTPRGPALQLRPRPESCQRWAEAAGFATKRLAELPGAPWHWGMLLTRA